MTSRDLRKLRANPTKFGQKLAEVDWTQLEGKALDSMVSFWIKSTTNALDDLAPLKTRKVSKKKIKLSTRNG